MAADPNVCVSSETLKTRMKLEGIPQTANKQGKLETTPQTANRDARMNCWLFLNQKSPVRAPANGSRTVLNSNIFVKMGVGEVALNLDFRRDCMIRVNSLMTGFAG